MNTPTTNDNGEYENYIFHWSIQNQSKCAILKTWYNPVRAAHCDGCPFFKTHEQFDKEKIKYSPKGVVSP